MSGDGSYRSDVGASDVQPVLDNIADEIRYWVGMFQGTRAAFGLSQISSYFATVFRVSMRKQSDSRGWVIS